MYTKSLKVKLGAVVLGAGLSFGAFGSGRVGDSPTDRTANSTDATSRTPSFKMGGPHSGQPSEYVIEVRAKVVDVRAGTMFLNVGGPVVRAELGGTELRRTPRSGEEIVVHLVRGDGLTNVVTGIWSVK